MRKSITVLIVDDHTIAREGLRKMLELDERIEVVGEAIDGIAAIDCVGELHPNVVLMDIRMPRMDGLDATHKITTSHPDTVVIIMTVYDDHSLVMKAIRVGACGFLLKDSSYDLLSSSIVAVAAGGMVIKADLMKQTTEDSTTELDLQPVTLKKGGVVEKLSTREKQILKLVAEGYTNIEIGKHLNLAEITIKKHVQNIIGKLGASNRIHAAILAMRMGLIK